MTKEEIRQEALKAEKERFPRCAGDNENSFHGVNSAYGLGFVDGALWMCGYNKSPWISVKDDLPYRHFELIEPIPIEGPFDSETLSVLVIDNEGYSWFDYMVLYKNIWKWKHLDSEPTYWMPIPELPKE